MNEEQALAQLRDIHLPAALEQSVVMQFAAWPFAVLALLVCVILLIRLWNRNHWRRRARAELSQILSIEEQTAQWPRLLAFATGLSARSGRSVTLPQFAFMRPDDLSEQQKSEFVSFLNKELGLER